MTDDRYLLIARGGRSMSGYASLTEAANAGRDRGFPAYQIEHRGIVVDRLGPAPTPTERLHQDVAAFLRWQPDADLGAVASAIERPEYLREYGRFLSTTIEIMRDLKEGAAA